MNKDLENFDSQPIPLCAPFNPTQEFKSGAKFNDGKKRRELSPAAMLIESFEVALTDTETSVLSLLFNLDGQGEGLRKNGKRKLKDVAQQTINPNTDQPYSRERIRQIEARALHKLRVHYNRNNTNDAYHDEYDALSQHDKHLLHKRAFISVAMQAQFERDDLKRKKEKGPEYRAYLRTLSASTQSGIKKISRRRVRNLRNLSHILEVAARTTYEHSPDEHLRKIYLSSERFIGYYGFDPKDLKGCTVDSFPEHCKKILQRSIEDIIYMYPELYANESIEAPAPNSSQ